MAPWNRFFAAICSISEYEFRPGHTVNFLAEVDLTEVERIRRRLRTSGGHPTRRSWQRRWLSLQEFP
jgi:hypothetical protein